MKRAELSATPFLTKRPVPRDVIVGSAIQKPAAMHLKRPHSLVAAPRVPRTEPLEKIGSEVHSGCETFVGHELGHCSTLVVRPQLFALPLRPQNIGLTKR